ncbi:MAG: RNA polymerase sigma factor [FCB group bacterium]|jgi:RNA polymerase sigma-70 factor (ECF subfamily)
MLNNEDKYYLEKVLKGDSASYSFIIEKYERMAYTIAYRILRQRENAEDVVQEAFINAYRSLPDFNFGASFSTWLYKIVYNLSISEYRKKKFITEEIDDNVIDNYYINYGNTNEAISLFREEEQKFYLNSAIDKLTPEEKTIITLYYQEDCSVEKVADITRNSKANVKIKLYRARKKIMHELEKILKEEVVNLI